MGLVSMVTDETKKDSHSYLCWCFAVAQAPAMPATLACPARLASPDPSGIHPYLVVAAKPTPILQQRRYQNLSACS